MNETLEQFGLGHVDFSVVVPVYNSEKSLDELYDRLRSTFEGMGRSFEVIFVNDNSTDGSYDILRSIHAQNNNTIVVDLMKNFGQQNALMCGFHYCQGKYVITLDDDLQNPPEEIPKLYAKMLDGYDAVFGAIESKRHRKYKNLGSYLIRRMTNRIFNTGERIKFSAFRMMKKSIVDEIKSIRTAFPYISGIILSSTDSVANVEIRHDPRKFGRSNYSIKKLVKLSLNLLLNYSSIPLRFVGTLGLTISFLSFLLGCIYIARKFMIGSVPAGWTSLVVLISFYNSITLVIFFIIGEYIARLLREISNYKQYSIREILR